MKEIKLTCTFGTLEGQTWTLKEKKVTRIGRENPAMDIQIAKKGADDITISRESFVLYAEYPAVYLADTASTCGTYLNDKKIDANVGKNPVMKDKKAWILLKDKDIIGAGKDGEVIKFQVTIPAEEKPVVKAEEGKGPQGKKKPAEKKKLSLEEAYKQLALAMNKKPEKEPVVPEEDDDDMSDEEIKDLIESIDIPVKPQTIMAKPLTIPTKPNYLKIVKQIGEGGQGIIYLVKNPEDGNKEQVLKVLTKMPKTVSEDYRMKREFDITMKLDHPYCVKAIDVFKDKGHYHFVSEYCDGGSLADLIQKKGGKLGYKEATEYILQTLNALEYLHNVELVQYDMNEKEHTVHGIVHRDIKPENILLKKLDNGKYQVKLADFGLAKAYELAGGATGTMAHCGMGTLAYLPRTQYLNAKFAKPYVDVFSITAAFYTMLTGCYIRPFTGNMKYNEQLILAGERTPISKNASAYIPAKLKKVIDSVLAEETKGENYEFTTIPQLRQRILDALK